VHDDATLHPQLVNPVTRGSIVPTPSVLAEVRVGEVPPVAPPTLLPFVTADDDWVLDAGPRVDASVVEQYVAWRATWVETFVLDPAAHLLALAERFDGGVTAHRWTTAWSAGRAAPIENPLELMVQLDDAHREIVDEGERGLGLIDVSPGDRRGSLSAAWSLQSGYEIVCATTEFQVAIDPAAGLCVRQLDGRSVNGVTEVALRTDAVEVIADEQIVAFDHHVARPLAWLVPGATRWRVRSIPEAVVWAKTFHRLREACLLSADHGARFDLRLGTS
jgi:hypothetical protein